MEAMDFITVPQIERATRLRRGLIYAEIARGRLPARKVGGRVVVEEADLHNYLEAARLAPKALEPERQA